MTAHQRWQVIVVSVGRWLRLTGPATGCRIGPLLSGRTRPVTTVATAATAVTAAPSLSAAATTEQYAYGTCPPTGRQDRH
ncbi:MULTISPECIES: hypothetical protein [unclassified Streptomyces]|uniref:hypothetical protein n=1 Tax=unclassified Streptomyces TaxID=2593676 RepID=UPI0035D562EF